MIDSQQIEQNIHITNQTDTADEAHNDGTDDHNGDEGVFADSCAGGILAVTDEQVSDENCSGKGAQENSDGVEQRSHNSAQQDQTDNGENRFVDAASDAACGYHEGDEQYA